MPVTRLNAAETIATYDTSGGDFFNFDTYGFDLTRLDNGNVVAAWALSVFSPGGSLIESELSTRLLTSLGAASGSIVTEDSITDIFADPTILGQDDSSYFVTYGRDPADDTELGQFSTSTLATFNASGAFVTNSLIESSPAGPAPTGEFFSTAARLDNGDTIVVWSDTHGTTPLNYDVNLLGRVYDAAGNPIGNSFDVSTPTTGIQLGVGAQLLADGRTLVTYNSYTVPKDAFSGVILEPVETALKGRFLSATGVPTGAEITIDTTAAGAFRQDVDILNLGSGGWAAVWAIDNPNGSHSIQMQVYSIAGAKVGGKVTLDTTFDGYAAFATVELANGGFAVAWENFSFESHIRYFNLNGVRVDADDVNTPGVIDDLSFGDIGGLGGLGMDRLANLELLANGTVMALGVTEDSGSDTATILTALFDTGLDNVVVGTAVANTLYGKRAFNDHIIGLAGNDTLFGLSGDDLLDGSSGSDTLNGGAGNDELRGGTDVANDVLNGGAGNDLMIGGAGNDTYFVDDIGDFVDELTGGSGNDTIMSSIDFELGDPTQMSGLVENLTLTGTGNVKGIGSGSGANVITGNVGNNLLYGGDEDGFKDTLRGGKGDDTYIVYGVDPLLTDQDTVVENANEGRDRVRTAVAAYTLTANVEELEFFSGNGQGTGNALNNLIIGAFSGANTLKGEGGNDVLYGSDGSDDALVDTLIGGLGNDTYYLYATVDTVTEAAGGGTADTIITDQVAFNLGLPAYAQIENLTYGGIAQNGLALEGNSLNNVLDGGLGIGGLFGGLGNDTYVIRNAGQTIVDTGGTADKAIHHVNLITQLATGVENLDLAEGSAATEGIGNAQLNIITGNSAANILSGGVDAIADQLKGGAGNDTYILQSQLNLQGLHVADIITEAAGAAGGIDTVRSEISKYTLAANVENLTLGETAGNIEGTGNGLDNKLTGNAGNNKLDGGGGNDILIVSGGEDTLIGGAGNDTVSFAGLANGVLISLAVSTLQSDYNGGQFTLSTIENIIGTGSDDELTGNTIANVLDGGASNDLLFGGAGNDTLLGGAGNDQLAGEAGDDRLDGGGSGPSLDPDVLAGGVGNDTYVIRDGTEVVVESKSDGTADTFESHLASLNMGAAYETSFVENLVLKISGSTGIGNALANKITGTTGDDTLDGGVEINPAAPVIDTLIGGAGNDIYLVRDTKDAITEAAGAAGGTADEVQTALATYTLTALNVEKLTYTGTGPTWTGTGNASDNIITGNNATTAYTLFGGGGNDTLRGRDLADTLDGGIGNDRLIGGAGNDTLIGGTGNDTAVFSRGLDNGDGTPPDGYSLDLTVTGDVIVDASNTNTADGVDTLRGIEFIDFDGEVYRLLLGTTAANTLTGTSGDDIIIGGAGNDIITGGFGNDILSADWGVSHEATKGTFLAGTADVLDYSKDVYGVQVDMKFGFDVGANIFTGGAIGFGIGEDFFEDFENVNGGSSDDLILGDDEANVLKGNAGNDFLLGRGGNDTLDGGTGIFDQAVFLGSFFKSGNGYSINSNADGSVTIDSDGADTGEGADKLIGIEFLLFDDNAIGLPLVDDTYDPEFYRLIVGTAAANTTLKADDFISSIVLGGGGNDIITGNDNFNILSGEAGNDTLFGGDGTNFLSGGAGNDILDGFFGVNDWAVFSDSTTGVTVSLAVTGAQVVGSLGSDTLIGIENLFGSSKNDTLTGDGGDNFIIGERGDDTIDGGLGTDTVGFNGSLFFTGNGYSIELLETGGDAGKVKIDSDGADTDEGADLLSGVEYLFFDDPLDTLGLYRLVTGSASEDTIDAAVDGDPLGANILMGGAGNDTLTGNDFFNVLSGGSGNDTLIGGASIDVLAGQADDDEMTGGAGGDFFVYENNLNFGVDTITDFEQGFDKIDLADLNLANGFADLDLVFSDATTSIFQLDPTIDPSGANQIIIQHGNGVTIDANDFIFV